MKKINCRFCKKEVTRDRFNVYLVLDRQDIPYRTNWQKSTERTFEDVCSKCREKIVMGLDQTVWEMENIMSSK